MFFETEKGYFYAFSNTQRYRFISKRVLDSWNPYFISKIKEDDPAVQKMKVVAKMKFRSGSLLYCQADGKMYLISNNKARHIKNPDWLEGLGLTNKDAVWVSEDEINLHEIGEPLT